MQRKNDNRNQLKAAGAVVAIMASAFLLRMCLHEEKHDEQNIQTNSNQSAEKIENEQRIINPPFTNPDFFNQLQQNRELPKKPSFLGGLEKKFPYKILDCETVQMRLDSDAFELLDYPLKSFSDFMMEKNGDDKILQNLKTSRDTKDLTLILQQMDGLNIEWEENGSVNTLAWVYQQQYQKGVSSGIEKELERKGESLTTPTDREILKSEALGFIKYAPPSEEFLESLGIKGIGISVPSPKCVIMNENALSFMVNTRAALANVLLEEPERASETLNSLTSFQRKRLLDEIVFQTVLSPLWTGETLGPDEMTDISALENFYDSISPEDQALLISYIKAVQLTNLSLAGAKAMLNRSSNPAISETLGKIVSDLKRLSQFQNGFQIIDDDLLEK